MPTLRQVVTKTTGHYWDHDIHHSRNVILRMGNIIPPETRARLNAVELTLLLLSGLLHDSGMVVSDQELRQTAASNSFRRFCDEGHADRAEAITEARTAREEGRARAIEDALLADYFRRLHPGRVRRFLEQNFSRQLLFGEIDFSDYLATLCESHTWGVEESSDPSSPEKAVRHLDDNLRFYQARVNLQYLACCLRLADILDFDRSRTPLAVFQHIDFTETKSWDEWNKHLQVQGYEITPTQVAFDIPCTHPVFYVAVQEFLDGIDEQLRQCRYLIENKPLATAERYRLLLPQTVDRHRVRMSDPSFVAGAFRFQLDYENIMKLLMDRSLYPDPSLFLRELLQNSLDACRRKEALARLRKASFRPEIVVWDHSADPDAPRIIFQDNGIGMSLQIVEHYFMRVGRSYYRSPEFDHERQLLAESGIEIDVSSQFGIGILSCFLVSDHFEVTTYQEGHHPLHLAVEGPTKYFVIRRLPRPASPAVDEAAAAVGDGPPATTGTRVTVHLRKRAKLTVYQTLCDFAVNVDYPITVYTAGTLEPKTIDRLRWEEPVLLSNVRAEISPILPKDAKPLAARIAAESAELFSASPLGEVIAESPIPFAKWRFSRYLRGRAWFWLLRAKDGGVCPERGYLEMENWPIPRGFPYLVTEARAFLNRVITVKLTRAPQLPRVVAGFGSVDKPFTEVLTQLSVGREHLTLGRRLHTTAEELDQSWRGISPEEQQALIRVLSATYENRGEWRQAKPRWYDIPGLPAELLRGSLSWVDQPAEFPLSRLSLVGFPIGIQELALHSIRLPAGIVEWTPVQGVASKVQLLPVTGGFRLDLRGRNAPIPAAHRLFVTAEQTRVIATPFLRAALRHGADLVATHERTSAWAKWFAGLFSGVESRLDSRSVIAPDRKYVEAQCGFEAVVKGRRLLLTRKELIGSFGHSVPLIARPADGNGLMVSSPINRFLLGRVLREATGRLSI